MKRVTLTSNKGYFSTYQSPNIVIDPNKSVFPPMVKKMKTDNERVYTNLKILQDNKMSNIYREMDSSLVKKINKDDLKKPIKSESSTNKTELCNGLYTSNTILMRENVFSKIKPKENYKPDNSQRENLISRVTPGVTLNSNKVCTNTDLNYKNQSFKDDKFNDNIKTEPNVNQTFDSNMGTSNKEGNCSERISKLTNCESNNNAVKNEENMDKKKTFKNKVKEIKEENKPKKFEEATKNNLAQENRKYPTKDVKQGKNKTGQPKTIKIIINVTYNNLHSKNNTKSSNSNVDGDLSFLDDFDVDGVVESLFNGKQQNKPIVNEEKVTESAKKRKTSSTEQNKKEQKKKRIKHTSKVDNKTEETKKTNIEKEKSPAEKNKRKNENDDCSVVPKNFDSKSKSSIITERKKDSKETTKEDCSKKVKCVDVDHNKNKKYNIGQGILNKFVTKSDKDLAHNLEIKMYETLKHKYSVLAVTHYGKFSKIFKCISKSGDCYAVKILDNPSPNHLKEKKKENILLELKKDIPEENLRCIHLLHSFQIDKHMCYMTNYYPINLEQLLIEKKFHIKEIQALAKQLVEAVTVLRSKNIVHHDIKPSHILLDDKAEKLTLCGFDEAILYVHSDNLKTIIGTVNYASPEKILGHSHGFPVDVWSTALVIYEMATNSMLFTGTTDNEVLFKQMSVLGNMPEYIIKESRFKNIHFRGTTFIKKSLNQYSDIRIHNFVKNNNIYSSIIAAQSARENYAGCENIEFKLQSLVRLLGRMLMLDPRKRLTIEYVYADNFFFEKQFDTVQNKSILS